MKPPGQKKGKRERGRASRSRPKQFVRLAARRARINNPGREEHDLDAATIDQELAEDVDEENPQASNAPVAASDDPTGRCQRDAWRRSDSRKNQGREEL